MSYVIFQLRFFAVPYFFNNLLGLDHVIFVAKINKLELDEVKALNLKFPRLEFSYSLSRVSAWFPEVESSRTHFEVLGLEASSPRKLPCPRLEDSTIFEPLKFR